GPLINPLLVEGQVQGGIAHSIGQVLFEHTVYDDHGQLLTGELMDYAIARAQDIPEYALAHTITPSPSNPLGVKGVGAAGTTGVPLSPTNATTTGPRRSMKRWHCCHSTETTRDRLREATVWFPR